MSMRRALHYVSLSIVLLCADAAWANTELLKTRSGSLVHWTGTEISVGVDPSAASRAVAQEGVFLAIQRAAETWNAVHAGQPRLHVALGSGEQVTVGFCRGKWHGDSIDLGKTQFTASLRDGAVTAATVEINECDHAFTAPDAGTTGRFDLEAIVTHELGHVLGLGHSDNPAAIMHPNGRGAEARRPNTDDKTALALIYFGRASAESERDTQPESAQAPADPHPTTHRGGKENTPVLADGPASALTSGAAHSESNSAPADLVSVLSLTAVGGRQVLVYTCEPTLLPPFGAAPAQARRSASHRIRNNAR